LEILDKLEKQVLQERVFVSASVTLDGRLRFAQQVVNERGDNVKKGKQILLSRKHPSDFEEQGRGRYKLNKVRKTVDLSLQKDKDGKERPTWASGVPQEIVTSDTKGDVYMKRLGAMVPRYKVDNDQRHFLKSLRRAKYVVETKQLGASYRSEQLSTVNSRPIVVGGSMS
jgi:hypothetical protein